MRIVGGHWRGRGLATPAGRGSASTIRPTSDRLRETIFNMLAHGNLKVGQNDAIAGAHVLDLFAGTGAMGLEALSRGASHALFIDDGAEARALLRANVEALGCAGRCRIFRSDATKLGKAPAGGKFTLAFLDPPYGKGLASRALKGLCDRGWLAAGAVCVIEEAEDAVLALPEGCELTERRVQGDTQVAFLKLA